MSDYSWFLLDENVSTVSVNEKLFINSLKLNLDYGTCI